MLESDPKVWRRIVVPMEYNFYELHLAIQAAFGWKNYHLFRFSENGSYKTPSYVLLNDDPFFNDSMHIDAKKAKIQSVFTYGLKYLYIYDFGDEWVHRIEHEKFLEEKIKAPYCLAGEGACPPEDCGGIGGYFGIMDILDDPKDPEHKIYMERLEWPSGKRWDPGFFDIDEANKRLSQLK